MRPARHYTELVAWELADELRRETLKLTSRPAFMADLKLRSQVEDAAHSVCRNIAEGFPCASHVEFARFLEISIRSLNELGDGFRGATLKGHVAPPDLVAVRQLTRRLFPALARLRAYLRRTPSPRDRHHQSRQSNGTDKR
jgi:four helix bundle protein